MLKNSKPNQKLDSKINSDVILLEILGSESDGTCYALVCSVHTDIDIFLNNISPQARQ